MDLQACKHHSSSRVKLPYQDRQAIALFQQKTINHMIDVPIALINLLDYLLLDSFNMLIHWIYVSHINAFLQSIISSPKLSVNIHIAKSEKSPAARSRLSYRCYHPSILIFLSFLFSNHSNNFACLRIRHSSSFRPSVSEICHKLCFILILPKPRYAKSLLFSSSPGLTSAIGNVNFPIIQFKQYSSSDKTRLTDSKMSSYSLLICSISFFLASRTCSEIGSSVIFMPFCSTLYDIGFN